MKTAIHPAWAVIRTAVELAMGTEDRLAVTRGSRSASATAGKVKVAKAPPSSTASIRIASGTGAMFLTTHAGPIVRRYCRAGVRA